VQIHKENCGKYTGVTLHLYTLTFTAGVGGGEGGETCRQGIHSPATFTAAAAAP
jgi:hypothetical protein